VAVCVARRRDILDLAAGFLAAMRLAGPSLRQQRAIAQTSMAQARAAGAVTRIIETSARRERAIQQQTEAQTDAISNADGADTPVPADVLAAWRAGLDGLRAAAGAESGDRDPR
jgi:hypothetical protein